VDGNITLGKLNCGKCNTFFTDTLFSITYFSHKMCCSSGSSQYTEPHTLQYNIPVQEQSACTQNSIHDNVQIMKNGQCGSLCHSDKVKWQSWQHKMKLD